MVRGDGRGVFSLLTPYPSQRAKRRRSDVAAVFYLASATKMPTAMGAKMPSPMLCHTATTHSKPRPASMSQKPI